MQQYQQAGALSLYATGQRDQMLAALTHFPGVVILRSAGGIGPGVGYLRAVNNGKRLQFKAPGGDTFGPFHEFAAAAEIGMLIDGEDVNKWLDVKAWPAFLPAGQVTFPVMFRNKRGNGLVPTGFDADDCDGGTTKNVAVAVFNYGAHTVFDFRAWLDASIASRTDMNIDGGAFVSPDSETHADVCTKSQIAPGGTATLVFRTTVAPGENYDPAVLLKYHAAFNAF